MAENDKEKEEQLAELQKMVTMAAGEIEGRLATSLNQAIAGINEKIDLGAAAAAELQNNAKIAFETLPNVIQENVETQLKANLKGIVEEVGKQFEGKVKEAGGGNSGTGITMESILANSDKLVAVVQAFRSPTTDQAMAANMGMIFKWHGLLSKIEKGGSSGEEITKAIQDTFGSQGQPGGQETKT